MDFKIDQDKLMIYKKLQTGLVEWAASLNNQSKLITNNLSSSFHFAKHENIELIEMLKIKK